MTGIDLLERTFVDQQVRIFVDDGEPWFVGRDVCSVLGIVNSRDALASLDDDEKGVATADTPGGPQQVATVNESGIYALVFRSRLDSAKAFRKWVTGTVLPEIRRTGSYSLAAPQTYPEALRALADEAEQREAAQQRAIAAESAVAALTPAAEAWEGVADAEGDHSVRDAAQMLVRAGIDTGERRLFGHLRAIGWIDRQNRPYQSHVDRGQLVQKIRTYQHPRTGETQTTTQLRITPKGIERLLVIMKPSPMGDTAESSSVDTPAVEAGE